MSGPAGAGPGREAEDGFRSAFGGEPDGVWFAPGRVNLVGEHTDYNDGFVLPLALAQGVAAAARRRDDDVLRVRSVQADEVAEVALDEIAPGVPGGWAAYVAGVLWALRADGHAVPGLDLCVSGDVPLGAGLSSSHALESAVAVAVDDLAGLGLGRTELALAVRTAENDLVGAPTGIMDQMASLHGAAGHALFLDCRSLDVEPVPFAMGEDGLALLVVDSRTPHALVDGEYAARREACAEGARRLGVPALRDVPLEDLDDALGRLADDVLRRRVRHVVTENARVLEVAAGLRDGRDPRAAGPALTASHVSMRDDFEITVDRVDVAVNAALAAGAYGARMTGGGFGGCIVALVDADAVGATVESVERAYAERGFDAPAAFVAEPSAGARRLS